MPFGYPVVKCELTDEMIETLIKRAYTKIAKVTIDTKFKSVPALACQDFEANTVIRVFDNSALTTSHTEKDVFSINVISRDSLMGSMKQIIIDRAYLDFSKTIMNYSFKFHDNKLYLDGLVGNVVVEYIPNYEEVELESTDEDWVTSYSLALCKEALGRIRGKFTPGTAPFTLDNEALLSEAQDEKSRLEEDLYEKKPGFFMVDVD